jgi:hypothetical protein
VAILLLIPVPSSAESLDCGKGYYDNPLCWATYYDDYLVVVPRFEYAEVKWCSRPECLNYYQSEHGLIVKGHIYGIGFQGESVLWYIVYSGYGSLDMYVMASQVNIVGFIYGYENYGTQMY